MQLKPYKIKIKTGGVLVALLHEEIARKLDLHVGDRVKLTSDRSEVICCVDITKDNFPKHKIGLFAETYDKMNIEKDDMVEIISADKPRSILHIRAKLDGAKLSPELNENCTRHRSRKFIGR